MRRLREEKQAACQLLRLALSDWFAGLFRPNCDPSQQLPRGPQQRAGTVNDNFRHSLTFSTDGATATGATLYSLAYGTSTVRSLFGTPFFIVTLYTNW